MKYRIYKILRRIYHFIPMKETTKQKLKNKFFNLYKKFKKNNKTIYSCNTNNPNNIEFSNIKVLAFDKKIAIHLHLFYLDLIDEFIDYFNNIPFKFDLYVSVSDEKDTSLVTKIFKNRLKSVNHVVVKKCENYGRDFGPMFGLFGNDLLKYDYLFHCHSKKSVRTGSEQDGWRKHMMDNCVGSSQIVYEIFNQFNNNNNLGLIYPETYENMPYWAHTWLYNYSTCKNLSNVLGFDIEDEYIDYSVGSFFWVKISAIKKLFDLKFGKDDFGVESGAADGTLAHALERMIPQVVIHSGYQYLVIDKNQKRFKSKGEKNLINYYNQNYDDILKETLKYDFISFDIFDTLLTRKISSPSKLFEILDKFVKDKYKIDNFSNKRVQAETNVRIQKKYCGDCSILEIYENLANEKVASKRVLTNIMNFEIDLEMKFCIPREDMKKLFLELIKNNKKIVLITDMYLTKDIIKKLLLKNGFKKYYKLLVSSDLGFRKDNGSLWNYYFSNVVKDRSSIHIGDNEHSDIQLLCDLGKPFIHVMNGNKMYKLTSYGDFLKNNEGKSIGDEILLGLIENKCLFNSPFKFNKNQNIIETYEELGYVIFGPILLNYFNFLTKKCKENKIDQLLFLSREGYFLEKIYKKYIEVSGIKEVNNTYLLTSRRSSSVCCINNEKDIIEIMKQGYEGNIVNYFETRLGIKINENDFFVKSKDDFEIISKYIKKYSKDIIKNSHNEKINYLKYLNSKIVGKKPAVVDLGYSGTIQYYLMKLLNKNINGYYFVLTDNVKPRKINGQAECCYQFDSEIYEKNIYRFSMILEAYLTAPVGQFIKIDDDGNPVYRNEIINNAYFKKLDELTAGVFKFFDDYIPIGKEFDLEITNEFIATNFSSLIYSKCLSEEIKKDFILDNSYSLDSNINVFDYLNYVYGEKNEN